MELFGVGNVILHFRKNKNISQTQVCEGICTEMTLSRVEIGDREFDSLISEALLGRIGKTANRFEFVLDEEDYYLYTHREKIKQCVEKKNPKQAEVYLKEYENHSKKDNILNQQFIFYYRAMIQKLKGGQELEIIELFHKAINLTRPDYKKKRKKQMLFNQIEVAIIYQLFLYENYEEDMLYSLLHFMDDFYDAEERERLEIPFLYHLVQRYERENNFHSVEKNAEKAIEIINQGRGYLHLNDFYFNKIKAQERIYYNQPGWDERKEELIEGCKNSYYMYMIEEEPEKMQEVVTFCWERLQCQIIEQEI